MFGISTPSFRSILYHLIHHFCLILEFYHLRNHLLIVIQHIYLFHHLLKYTGSPSWYFNHLNVFTACLYISYAHWIYVWVYAWSIAAVLEIITPHRILLNCTILDEWKKQISCRSESTFNLKFKLIIHLIYCLFYTLSLPPQLS